MLYNTIRFPILPSNPSDCLQSSPENQGIWPNSNRIDEILNFCHACTIQQYPCSNFNSPHKLKCFSLDAISDCLATLPFFIFFFFCHSIKCGHLYAVCHKSQMIHPLTLATLHFIPSLLLLLSYFKSSLETILDLELLGETTTGKIQKFKNYFNLCRDGYSA